MSNIEKKCIVCGQSCAGQPRIKDASGNYAHRACAEKHQAKQDAKAKQPEIEPLDLSPEEEPGMADFLDDLPSDSSDQPPAMRAACPSCGTSVSSDSMICMSCGCNIKTGRGNKTKAVKVKAKKDGPGIGAKAGSFAIAPLLPVIGACIGGAIGAAVWAAVAYFLNYELGILAAGVGAVCGIGAAIGAGGQGNAWSGLVAVVVAMISIIVGKSAVYTIYLATLEGVQEQMQSQMIEDVTMDTLTLEDIYQGLVDEIAQVRIDRNKDIDWPASSMTLEEAYWPEDYPQDLIDETHEEWDAMDEDDQLAFREDRVVTINANMAEFNQMVEDEIAVLKDVSIFDNLGLFDALWAFLALGAAWQFGSGND